MKRSVTLSCLMLLAVSAARAQGPAGDRPDLLSTHARAEMGGSRSPGGRFGQISLHAAAAGVLGAGLGYFFSHVLYSDWDRSPNRSFTDRRRGFAAAGGAVGAVGGLLWSRRTLPSTFEPLPLGEVAGSAGARAILLEEIDRAGGANAFDIVQVLRPAWLTVRGVQRLSESARGRSVGREVEITAPALPSRMVYMDNARLGDLTSLRQIPREMIGSIQFFDAAAANYRWGSGHAHGVILVTTMRDGR